MTWLLARGGKTGGVEPRLYGQPGSLCNRADVGIGPYGVIAGNVTHRAVDAEGIPAAPGQRGSA